MANQNIKKNFTSQVVNKGDALEPNTLRSTLNTAGQSTDQSATLTKEGLVRPDGTSITIVGNVITAKSIDIPAFSAYGTATVSTANNTFTKIPFNQIEFDHAGRFDTANNRYYAPVKGIYQISAAIAAGTSNTGYLWIALYKNGVLFKYGAATPNSSQGPVNVASWTVELGIGEYIEIWGQQSSGGALNIGSSSSAYSFSGFLIKQTA